MEPNAINVRNINRVISEQTGHKYLILNVEERGTFIRYNWYDMSHLYYTLLFFPLSYIEIGWLLSLYIMYVKNLKMAYVHRKSIVWEMSSLKNGLQPYVFYYITKGNNEVLPSSLQSLVSSQFRTQIFKTIFQYSKTMIF